MQIIAYRQLDMPAHVTLSPIWVVFYACIREKFARGFPSAESSRIGWQLGDGLGLH